VPPGPPALRATPRRKKDESLAFRKPRLATLTWRIDPTLRHFARTVKRAGRSTLTIELANAAAQCTRLINRHGFDSAFCRIE